MTNVTINGVSYEVTTEKVNELLALGKLIASPSGEIVIDPDVAWTGLEVEEFLAAM